MDELMSSGQFNETGVRDNALNGQRKTADATGGLQRSVLSNVQTNHGKRMFRGILREFRVSYVVASITALLMSKLMMHREKQITCSI